MFFGYVLTSLIVFGGLVLGVSSLHRSSRIKPFERLRHPLPIRSRAVLTFSIILPFSILAYLFLYFGPMSIVQSLVQEGHYSYVLRSLVFPTLSFWLGYSCFKKAVRP